MRWCALARLGGVLFTRGHRVRTHCLQTRVAVAKELRALGARAVSPECDVSHWGAVEDAVAATITEFGSIDVVVNNAQHLDRIDRTFVELAEDDMRGANRTACRWSKLGAAPNPWERGLYLRCCSLCLVRPVLWSFGARLRPLCRMSLGWGLQRRVDPTLHQGTRRAECDGLQIDTGMGERAAHDLE